MPPRGIRPNISIRIDSDVLHIARIGAVIDKKTLGEWLEEAILEKVEGAGEKPK